MRVDRRHQARAGRLRDHRGRASARCARTCSARSRPQSLIGEYFVDCRPGTRRGAAEARRDDPGRADRVDDPARPRQQHHAPPVPRAAAGSSSTSSAPASAAARATSGRRVRRAVPALRETDRVLAILADQNQVLGNLTRDADTVDRRPRRQPQGRRPLRDRDARRPPPPRPSAAPTSPPACSACPAFLRELEPTMAELGAGRRRADARAAPTSTRPPASSRRCFENLPASPTSSRRPTSSRWPSVGRDGRPAAAGRAADVAELDQVADQDAGARATTSAIVLEHLDDRKHAVEKDPRSPGGKGYTGFEALLQYVFDQSHGDQHLRLERLHAEGQPLPVASARTTRTRSR